MLGRDHVGQGDGLADQGGVRPELVFHDGGKLVQARDRLAQGHERILGRRLDDEGGRGRADRAAPDAGDDQIKGNGARPEGIQGVDA